MFATCRECGMKVIPGEYHPYTACVLYKHTRQAEKVESMIRAVVQYGYEAAQGGIPLEDALRNIAASNKACSGQEPAGASESQSVSGSCR